MVTSVAASAAARSGPRDAGLVNGSAHVRGPLPSISDVDDELASSVVDGLSQVETQLGSAVAHSDSLADATSRHLLQAGGKRVRPMLALLSSHLGGGISPAVVQACVVVELVHLASLYHDDVMDSAPERRGTQAAHAVWGNNVAILTGDLLFARASRLVAELGPDAVRHQALVFERLCLGQLHESEGPRPGEDAVAHHLQVLSDKTGSLIALAARFGAWLAGASPQAVDQLVAYGEKVGVAFQIADDVLDLSRAGESGKRPGTDLREGVATLPVLLAAEAAATGDALGQQLVTMLATDLSHDAALDAAVDALAASPFVARAQELAHDWAAGAVAALDGLPEGPVTSALASFAWGVVDRDR